LNLAATEEKTPKKDSLSSLSKNMACLAFPREVK